MERDYALIKYKLSDFQDLVSKKVINPNLPDKLYKFMSLFDYNGLDIQKINSLKNNQVWFQNILGFNDIFENKAAYIDFSNGDDDCEGLQAILNIQKKFTYAFCMTNVGIQNFSMWGNYADEFKGICVEYNIVNDYGYIHRVEYIDKPCSVNKVIRKLMSADNRVDFFKFMQGYSDIKSKCWEHENEYRILAKKIPNDIEPWFDEENPSLNKGFNVPLSELGLEVNRVYVTEKCNPEVYEKLKSIFKNKLRVLTTKIDSFELIEKKK